MNQTEYNNFRSLNKSRNNSNDDSVRFLEKGSKAAGNAAKTIGTASNVAGKSMQVAGRATQFTGKGMQYAGKGLDAAGGAITKAGTSLSQSGYGAILGVPLAAAGMTIKAGGKGTQIAGKAAESGGKGLNISGQGLSNSGKNIRQTGKNLKNFSRQLGRARMFNNKMNNLRDNLPDVKKTLSLFKYIKFSLDWLMGIALVAAILKDILDFVGFSLPVINDIINFCVGIIIMFALILMGSRNNRLMVKNWVKKWIVLLGGFLGEELFGLNFLPIETITVLICYYLILIERKQDQEAEEKNDKQIEQQQKEYAQAA